MGTALDRPANMYLIMVGTDDLQSAGCTSDGMVQGYSRIVVQLRVSVKAVFKTCPRFFLLAPPSMANSKAEKRRKRMLYQRWAYDTGAHLVPSVALARSEMLHDGMHWRPAGAKIIATAVAVPSGHQHLF